MAALSSSRWQNVFPKSLEAARDVNQLFDAFFQNGASGRTWFAAAALWEANDGFYVDVEMPGVQREDIEITLEKNVLNVAAERKTPEDERTYWHNERGYGKVERSISLPESVDPESIEAELRDGVLHLKLSKRPETLPKKVEIK
jgi:HSP20 family protein